MRLWKLGVQLPFHVLSLRFELFPHHAVNAQQFIDGIVRLGYEFTQFFFCLLHRKCAAGLDQLFLIGHMPVDRLFRNAQFLSDLVHGHRFQAVALEEL